MAINVINEFDTEQDYLNFTLDYLKSWENTTGDYNPHFEGKSVALGMGWT